MKLFIIGFEITFSFLCWLYVFHILFEMNFNVHIYENSLFSLSLTLSPPLSLPLSLSLVLVVFSEWPLHLIESFHSVHDFWSFIEWILAYKRRMCYFAMLPRNHVANVTIDGKMRVYHFNVKINNNRINAYWTHMLNDWQVFYVAYTHFVDFNKACWCPNWNRKLANILLISFNFQFSITVGVGYYISVGGCIWCDIQIHVSFNLLIEMSERRSLPFFVHCAAILLYYVCMLHLEHSSSGSACFSYCVDLHITIFCALILL